MASIEDERLTKNARRRKPGEAPTIELFGRRMPLPRSRWVRIPTGGLLVVFGTFGFLPVLGFWMLPLGLFVLSYDIAAVRRLRRRGEVRWGRSDLRARIARWIGDRRKGGA